MKRYRFCALGTSFVWALAVGISSVRGQVAPDNEVAELAAVPLGADRLVNQALEAEIAGDAELRAEKLAQALDKDPTFAPARWHSGMIRAEGAWLAWRDVQDASRGHKRLGRYRELRAQGDPSLASHVKLARWCARNDLLPQSRAHWMQVLLIDPHHRAALGALDLVWHGGTLVSPEEKKLAEAKSKETKGGLEAARSKIKRWLRDIEKGHDDGRQAALAQIKSITDPDWIPVVLTEFAQAELPLEQSREMRAALVHLYVRLENDFTTRMLARHALAGSSNKSRDAATYELKDRPMHVYVPLLLARMSSPVEVATYTSERGGSLTNTYTYSREDAAGNVYETSRSASRQLGQRYVPRYSNLRIPGYEITIPAQSNGCGGYIAEHTRRIPDRFVTVQDGYSNAELPEYRRRKQQEYQRSRAEAEYVKRDVERMNRSNEMANRKIASLLGKTTGVKLEPEPRVWRRWWQEYLDEHPEVRAALVERGGPFAASQRIHRPGSFPIGTVVWTSDGETPIQNVTIGDEVLSQDPETGELAYKVVAHTAHSGEVAMRFVRLGDDNASFASAPGNLVWSSGEGWRMASSLKPGTLVHGIEGSTSVSENFETRKQHTIQLVVLDFHTLLIGKEGVLVRDATVPKPSERVLPGLARR